MNSLCVRVSSLGIYLLYLSRNGARGDFPKTRGDEMDKCSAIK